MELPWAGATAIGNRVYHNTGVGIQTSALTVVGNKVYGNATGIYSTGSGGRIADNLVYANVNRGIRIGETGGGTEVVNNTVYQPVGDAVRIEGGSSNVRLSNNILSVDAGYDISIDPNSQAGLASNYNLLHTGPGPNAFTGFWANVVRDTLGDWQSASGQDALSTAADPLFRDRDGADNILGFAGGQNGGADDNFHLRVFSPAIDHADAWAASTIDAEGLARSDDPGTTNSGRPDYVEHELAGSLFTPAGSPTGWRHSDASWSLALPFAFSFYDATHTSVTVSSEGFLHFAGPDPPHSGANSAEVLLRNRRIAPLWDDLRTDGAGDDIFVEALADQITIRWDATTVATGTDVDFSVTLFADGTFRFDYGPGTAA